MFRKIRNTLAYLVRSTFFINLPEIYFKKYKILRDILFASVEYEFNEGYLQKYIL